jgi:amidase
LGSDTGGSIRFPANANGTVGIKPTRGLVSRHGVLDLAQTLDHVGPLSRSTADAAITLQIISAQDPDDPTSIPQPPLQLFTPGPTWALQLDGALPIQGARLRIGLDTRYNSDGVDQELSAAVEQAARALAAATGGEIVTCAMPPPEELQKYDTMAHI